MPSILNVGAVPDPAWPAIGEAMAEPLPVPDQIGTQRED